MLKSERLILAVALAPQASFLASGCGMHWNEVTARVTGLLTLLEVRVPSIATGLSPSNLNALDLKVMVGYFSASKKSSPFKWPLKTSLPVSTDFTSMLTSAEPVLAARSMVILPVTVSKRLDWVE